MQRWQGARITHPLAASDPMGAERMASDPMAARPSSVTEAPTVRVRAVPVPTPTSTPAAPSAPAAGRAGEGDPAEIGRIREILVGPHLRDHERRLRTLEQRQAEPVEPAGEPPASWTARVEEALARVRQAREEQDQAHAYAVARLNAQLSREQDERADFVRALDALRVEQQALRAELERERQAREELAATHAQALAQLAQQLDQTSQSHVRLHTHLSTELDARLEQERQVHAETLRQLEAGQAEALRAVRDAQTAQDEGVRTLQSGHAELVQRLDESHGVRVDALRELVGEAERALTTMQAERQYLAGLLAELGLHLVRHAGSPAASRAAQAATAFFDAAEQARES